MTSFSPETTTATPSLRVQTNPNTTNRDSTNALQRNNADTPQLDIIAKPTYTKEAVTSAAPPQNANSTVRNDTHIAPTQNNATDAISSTSNTTKEKTDATSIEGEVKRTFDNEIIVKAVGAKSITDYDVVNPLTGEKIKFVEGSRPIYPKDHLLAGKGSKNRIRKIVDLLEINGGKAEDWKHEKAYFRVFDDFGEECYLELHWFECGDGVKYDVFPKLRNGEIYFYDIDEWEDIWAW